MIIKYLIFFIIIFNYNLSFSKEKIVFSINDLSYSTIDIEKKINYLLFLNSIEYSKSNVEKFFKQGKKSLIETRLISEFIKEKNIEISENDYRNTYNDLINLNNKERNVEFETAIKIYNLEEKDIKEEVINEVSLQKFNQIIANEIKMKEIDFTKLNIGDYTRYEINNIILYKKNIIENEFIKQKKIIFDELKEKTFKETINKITNMEFNISYNLNKKSKLKSFNFDNEIKKMITKAKINEIFFFENKDALFIFKILSIDKPEIEMKFSFIQVISNEKKILEEIYKRDDICVNNNFEKIITNENIKKKYFKDVSSKDLNKSVFDNLNNNKNKLIISNNSTNFLIIVCKREINENNFREYIINTEYLVEFKSKKKEIFYKLKNKYNFIEY